MSDGNEKGCASKLVTGVLLFTALSGSELASGVILGNFDGLGLNSSNTKSSNSESD